MAASFESQASYLSAISELVTSDKKIEYVKDTSKATIDYVKDKSTTTITYVKDTSVTTLGKVNGVTIYVQQQSLRKLATARSLALETFARIVELVKAYKGNPGEIFIDLRAQANGGILFVCKEVQGCSKLLKEKALLASVPIQAAVEKIPTPLKYKEYVTLCTEKGRAAIMYVRGEFIHIYAKIDDALVQVRMRVSQSVDAIPASKAEALEMLERVKAVVQTYLTKLHDGSIAIKGKINGAVVQIKSVSDVGAKAWNECEHIRKSIYAKGKAAKERVQVLKTEFGAWVVHRKDGIVQILGQTKETYVKLEGVVNETKESLRLRVLVITKADSPRQFITTWTTNKFTELYSSAKNATSATVEAGKTKALARVDSLKSLAADRNVQLLATGGFVGATTGGAMGLTTGTVAGAACGLPLALFSFGLSVPVGAIVGGSAGTSVGAVAGAAAGLVGGHVAGYGSEQCAEIRQKLFDKVSPYKNYMQEGVSSSVSMVRARIVGSTGGIDSDAGSEVQLSER